MKSMLKLIVIAVLTFQGTMMSRAQDNAAAQDNTAVEKERANAEKGRASSDKERAKVEKERAKAEKTRGDDHAYAKARKFVDKGQWEEALKAFDETGHDTDRADAALYWKAYAQNKLGRGADALATLANLSKEFPQSRWLDDSKALEAEIRQSSGQKVD